ncbi:MAG: HAMP domain-containing protein [Geobacter sp.]|nr:HAMP domain-containing protein [Geobacter sp.]
MFRKSLALKVLGILGISLSLGFIALGAVSLWLQAKSTTTLQLKNARNVSAIIANDIDEYMMKGDSKLVTKYIDDAKKKKFVLDLKIYNPEGKESEAAKEAQPNKEVVKAIETGKEVETTAVEEGIHVLNLAVPLENEERCKECHDKEPKYLGGISLKTSVQDGYDSSRNLAFMLMGTGVCFFFILLATIYLFMRKAVINHILKFVKTVEELASAGGDLTRTLPVSSGDEIGALAEGINKLISKIRDIMTKIAGNAQQLSVAARQLSETSERMVSGIGEAVGQTGTVATASEEMAATSCEIAHNCVAAADESKKASSSATAGTQVVESTVSVMNRIAGKVKQSAATIEVLGKKSDQIGEIIVAIQDIADQTNLLALNAAIEAARAGEQGRGFAVVADEVRALAERTTKATREIGEMIKGIQSDTKGAVSAMEEGVKEVAAGTSEAARSGDALNEILEQINSVTMQVNQIATAAEQQTATTSEISHSILQVTTVVRETEQGAQETASAAAQLAHLAQDLQRLVGQFKLA